MKRIRELTDRDITGGDLTAAALPRIAVRAVLRDADDLIAIIHAEDFGIYNFPGGGVEPNETLRAALLREVLEETGCACKIEHELGYISENRGYGEFVQISNYFTARVIGEKGAPSMTREEMEARMRLIWLPLEEARERICEQDVRDYRLRFIVMREAAAMEAYLSYSMAL